MSTSERETTNRRRQLQARDFTIQGDLKGVRLEIEDRGASRTVTVSQRRSPSRVLTSVLIALGAAITGHLTFEAIGPWLQILILRLSGV